MAPQLLESFDIDIGGGYEGARSSLGMCMMTAVGGKSCHAFQTHAVPNQRVMTLVLDFFDPEGRLWTRGSELCKSRGQVYSQGRDIGLDSQNQGQIAGSGFYQLMPNEQITAAATERLALILDMDKYSAVHQTGFSSDKNGQRYLFILKRANGTISNSKSKALLQLIQTDLQAMFPDVCAMISCVLSKWDSIEQLRIMDYLGNVSAPRDLALGHHMDMRRCDVQTFLQRADDLGGRQCYRLPPSSQHTFKNVYGYNEKGVNKMLPLIGEKHGQGRPRKDDKPPRTEWDVEELHSIASHYENTTMTLEQIAAEHDCTVNDVDRVRQEFQLPMRNSYPKFRTKGFKPDLKELGWRLPLAHELDTRGDGNFIGVQQKGKGGGRYQVMVKRHGTQHYVGAYDSALEAAQHRKLYLVHELGEDVK